MNSTIISIPNRWQEGAYQIKTWIEHYAGVTGHPLSASIAGETDSGQIWITGCENLTEQEREAADNAVQILNDRLNRAGGEPWKAHSDAERELAQQLAEPKIKSQTVIAKSGFRRSRLRVSGWSAN